MYRKQEEGKEIRWARKIQGKENWFKGEPKREEGENEEERGEGGRYIGGIWWKEVDRENREKR